MASFNDLGLREGLVMALEEEGIEHPTALQQAAVPVLRREGNLVARAGSGSGKTLAYALGVLDRLEPRAEEGDEDEEGEETVSEAAGRTRALVLVPTAERAEQTALSLIPFAAAVELTLTAAGPGWGTPAGEADVLVATPAQVMEAVRTSGIKLDAVEAVVVDGASEIEALGGWEQMEGLFDNIPRTAQRVIVSGAMTPAVQDLIDRRVKRAIRYPAESQVPQETGTPEVTGVVGYVPVSEREKVDVVARLLGGDRAGEAAPVLVCRTDERASQVAEALAMRGFLVGDADDEDADVAVVGSDEQLAGLGGNEGPSGTVISFDVPADEHSLRARHGGGMTGFVLVEPRELPHLREIAPRAGVDARAAGNTGETAPGADELRVFRQELRRAVREEDLGAQMLVLEPLFEDFTAAEVAAACAALLRRRRASEPAEAPAPAADGGSSFAPRSGTVRAAPAPRAKAGGAPAATQRLYIGVGERDNVRAGDLVGAIAGETDIPGSSIGKVEIRDTFSIVEVPADMAERVIEAVNGTTIKGRSVRVDYDRAGDRAKRGDRPGGRDDRGGGGFRGGGGGGGGFRGGGGGGGGFRGGGGGGGGDRPRGKFGPPRDGGGGGRDGGGGGTRRPPVRRPPRPRDEG